MTSLLGLAGLANVAFRSLQDWLLVMLALGVPHLAVLLREAAARGRRRAWVARLLRLDCACKRLLYSPLLRFQPSWLAAGVAVLACVSLLPPLARRLPIREGEEWPARAVNRIEE